jgi:hypothetical protein
MADAQEATPTRKSKVEKTPVKMKDGTVVEFNSKQKVVKSILDNSVRFDFNNGETREVAADVGGPAIQTRFTLHGISQKFGDEGAGAESTDDFLYDFDSLYDRISKGEWTEKREGGVGGISVLAKALVEATGKEADAIREFLKPLSPAEKIALRNSAQLKPIVERLEAEKAKQSNVDVTALMAKIAG